jgi:hypothetical protein
MVVDRLHTERNPTRSVIGERPRSACITLLGGISNEDGGDNSAVH